MNDDNTLRPVEPMWSAARIAAYMSVDIQTVYRWMWSGKLASVKVGSTRRVPQSEVLRLVNDTRKGISDSASQESTSEATEQ